MSRQWFIDDIPVPADIRYYVYAEINSRGLVEYWIDVDVYVGSYVESLWSDWYGDFSTAQGVKEEFEEDPQYHFCDELVKFWRKLGAM